MDFKARIEAAPMRKAQVGIVAICLALNFIDGYDVLVMAFSANAISEAWGLSGAQLGMLLSSALAGMAIGAVFVAQLADRIGRRRMIILATSVITVGMFASAFATGYEMLLVIRVLTGIAVGSMQSNLNVLVSEYSNAKRRSTAVSVYSTGQPIGGVLGGIIVSLLLGYFDWQAGFIFGGIITLIMLPIVLKWLPESLDYLEAKRPDGAVDKINAILVRLHQPVIDRLAERDVNAAQPKVGLRAVFAEGRAAKTILLAIAYMMIMASFYFANSWTPQLLSQSGYSASQGIQAGVLFSLGAIVGSLVFAYLGGRFTLKRVLSVTFVLAAASFVFFSAFADQLSFALIAAVLVGVFTNAAIAGMFSIGPVHYEAHVRATAVGLITGLGRAATIISPILAGALIDAGWLPGSIYFLFVVPLLVGAVAIALLPKPIVGQRAEVPAGHTEAIVSSPDVVGAVK